MLPGCSGRLVAEYMAICTIGTKTHVDEQSCGPLHKFKVNGRYQREPS